MNEFLRARIQNMMEPASPMGFQEDGNWSVGNLVRYSWLDSGIEDLPRAGAQTSGTNCLFEHEKTHS